MSGITTHVLDTSTGTPASGISVVLSRVDELGDRTLALAEARTNQDGRVKSTLALPLETGTYRLTFDTAAYFREKGMQSFYPEVSITFEVRDPDQHYHVPLLLSPFGYSTYRGS